jgi:A/G-specific adenine glycosylase
MIKLPAKHILTKLEEREKFQNVLLEWYDQAQRQLPWRTDPSLYKTVVSEFMLQQTRVSTVLPYFKNWLEKFPDFHALAQAKEEEVLKGWEGLGYYSRAKNLHKLSRIVSTWKFIPTDLQSWLSLPGVGPYIASAVTSISFNQPQAVCDGNVVRVLTRIFAYGESFKDGASAQKKLAPIATQILNHQRPGDYNQAVMELGATVCHRQSPLCTICPVYNFCRCGKQGDPENFPVLAKKKKSYQKVTRFWIEKEGAILLQKPQNKGTRMAGIYELPQNIESELPQKGKLLAVRKRTIGQVEYEESIQQFTLNPNCDLEKKSLEWIQWEKLNEITLSGPHRKWIIEIKSNLLRF